jgi:purine-binding chemotaxis protein CheW
MTPIRRGRQRAFLGLSVADVQYAVPIECVREVCKPLKVISVPNRPQHALGVVHYRQQIIFAFSLRSKFALPEAADPKKYFIVLEFSASTLVIVADQVHGVFRAAREDDLATPGAEQDAILFAMQRGDNLVFALDVEPFGRAIEQFETPATAVQPAQPST